MEIFTVFQVLFAAYSAFSQAQAARDAAEYNAAVARNNEILANAEKAAEAERGVEQELDQRRATRQLKGQQIAGMAAAGLDLSEGSAADILAGTDWMGEVDALRIRDQSARNQWAIGEKARGYAAEASVERAKAKASNPALAGVGSLLIGAPKLAASYKANGGNWSWF